MISGIITASGLSKRFGSDKLFYKINGKYIISYVIENVNNSNLNEKIIVINNYNKYKSIIPENFKIIINNDYLNGMSSSIINGIKNISINSEAAMIIPGDMPLINKNIINKLIEYFNKNNYGIAGLLDNDIIKSPVIFSRKYFNELLKLSGDHGGKIVIEKHLNDFSGIKIDENLLKDVDYINDAKLIEEMFNKKH